MTNLKELEAQVKKEELELEKAKSDLAKAEKDKKKSSSRKSKKEKQREIEERLKKVDMVGAVRELGIKCPTDPDAEANWALVKKDLIEKASLTELEKFEKAAASFLDREKKKDEEKKLKREVALQQLESLGLDINSLKELIKG